MARNFKADVRYREGDGAEQQYDLRVNHPLKIGSTELFLIGHGYAPVITVRDGNGDIAYYGPTVFLPRDRTFSPSAWSRRPTPSPARSGWRASLYPTFA